MNGRAHDFRHGTVVPEVNHFCTVLLQQAADDVDGGVVAVEQGGRADETQGRGLGAVGRGVGRGGGGDRHGATHWVGKRKPDNLRMRRRKIKSFTR